MELVWQLRDYIAQGGWIMIPLGLVSVVMWVLIAERLLTFRQLERDDVGVQDVLQVMRGEAPGHLGEGLRASVMRAYLELRSGDPELDKHIVRQCAMRMRPQLNRYIALIAVLAGIAPLLGLLGTVIGMIETFDVISLFGTGNAKALAGGISVALVTTQSGLLVAIPGLLLSATLARRSSALLRSLDEITVVLQNHIIRRVA